MPDVPEEKPPKRTIAGLRLDLESARAGKTWLLLPDGFRDQACGTSYPLPSSRKDLQALAAIYIPEPKNDSGCVYLRRALKKYKERQGRASSAANETMYQEHRNAVAQRSYRKDMDRMRDEAKNAVDGIKEQVGIAVATLTDLFALGRKGLKAQMEAYLANEELHGEKISHQGFRQGFQMVTAAVKGLGVPDSQKKDAQSAILEQTAAAMRDTQDAIALAPGPDDEIEH